MECNRYEWMLRMRRMGSCPCKQPGRPIARFHSNPSGKCLAGRSAALRRLLIAELSTAHRALHPIPARYLRGPEKIVNTFLWLGAPSQTVRRACQPSFRGREGPCGCANLGARRSVRCCTRKERNDEWRARRGLPFGLPGLGAVCGVARACKVPTLLRTGALHPTPRSGNAIPEKRVGRPSRQDGATTPAGPSWPLRSLSQQP